MVSRKQHNFMEAVKHGMKPRGGGPSQAQAAEFVAADKAEGKYQSKKLTPGHAKRLAHALKGH